MAQITDQQISSLIYSMRAIYNASSTFLDSIDKFDVSFNSATKSTNEYGKATKTAIKDFSRLHDATEYTTAELKEFQLRIRNNRRSIDEAIKALDDYSDTVDAANTLSKQNSKDLKNLTDVFQLSAKNISFNAQAQLNALKSINAAGGKELLNNIIQTNSVLGNELSDMVFDTNKKINDSILDNQKAVSESLNNMFNVLGDTRRIKEYVEAKDQLLYELSKTPDTKLASDEMRNLANGVVALGKEIGIATNITNKYGKNVSVLDELSKVSAKGGVVSPEILSALNINADKIDVSLGRFGEILIDLSHQLDNPDVATNYTKLYKSLNTFFMGYSDELKNLKTDNVLNSAAFLKAIKEDKNTLLQLKRLAGIGETLESGNLSNKQVIKELEKLQSLSTTQSNPIVQQLIDNAKNSLNVYDFNKSMQKFVVELSKDRLNPDEIINSINKLAEKKESANIASSDFDKLSTFVIESNKIPEILLKKIGELLIDTNGVIDDSVKTVIDQLYDINKHAPISSSEFELFNTRFETILSKSNNDIAQAIADTTGFNQNGPGVLPFDARLDKIFPKSIFEELSKINTTINYAENTNILKSINSELKKTKKISGEELKRPFEALANGLSETIKQATDVSDASHIAANVTMIREMGKVFDLSFTNIRDTIDQNTTQWKELPDMVAANFGKYMKEASGISLQQDVNGTIEDKKFTNYENMIASMEDFNRKMRDTLINFEQNNNEINADNYKIVEDLIKSAEALGLANHQNIIDLKNSFSAFDPNKPYATAQNVGNVEELKNISKDFIDAFSKIEKKIKQDNYAHANSFKVLLDNHITSQSGTFTKLIHEIGKVVSGGGGGSMEGVEGAIAQLNSRLIPAIMGAVKDSRKYINDETDAMFENITLNRSKSFIELQETEAENRKKLAENRELWNILPRGIADFEDYQASTRDMFRETFGYDAEHSRNLQLAITKTQRLIGFVTDESDLKGKENQARLDKITKDISIAGKGSLSKEQATDIFNVVSATTEYQKTAFQLDKKQKAAQQDQLLRTIKFASALNMSADAAKEFAIAATQAGVGLSPQEAISNQAAIMQLTGTLGNFANSVGVNTDAVMANQSEMSRIAGIDPAMRNEKDREAFAAGMLDIVATKNKADEAFVEKYKNAQDEGERQRLNLQKIQMDDMYNKQKKSMSAGYSEQLDILEKQLPMIEKKRAEHPEMSSKELIDTILKENEGKEAVVVDEWRKNLKSFSQYWDKLNDTMFGVLTPVAGLLAAFIGGKMLTNTLTKIVTTAVSSAVAGAAGAGAAEVVAGGAVAAVLPELLALLAGGAGIAMLAYGAKGLYDHVVGNDVIYKADRGEAIHGIVDVNNLDIYTNQVTDAIDNQTDTLLKGFSSIMGKPISTTIINNTAGPEKKVTPEGYGYKPYPSSTTIPQPSSGLNVNPPNGTNNTTIEQPAGPLPSNKISNADMNTALEDLKSFLMKELINGLMDNMKNISTNTGNTAKNTSEDGVLGGLVDALTKPAYQPYQRGPVEKSSTVTG